MSQYFLARSTRIRISAFTLFYMAQGIPIGLMSVAMPGWFASESLDGAHIATFVSVTGLPWGFKLIAGPFMDRFSFPAMGYRRPWVMAAQGGLTVAMLCMAAASDVNDHFALMVTVGFIINCFAAVQDVAVDGMAIDILPESERGRANAFMAFGQVAGYSVYGALCGWLLTNYGLPVTSLICGVSILAVFVFVTLVREREGERLMPWSPGEATPRALSPAASFREIFRDLIRVVFLPMSLILTAAEFCARMGAGISLTIAPLIAVQDLGYTAPQYAYWSGIASAVGAVIGLGFGPLVDRYGAKPLLMAGLLVVIFSLLVFVLAPPLRPSDTFVVTLYLIYQIGIQMMFVAVIAGFMIMCWTQVAATQFSIYMSLANLARSVGAAIYGVVAAHIANVDAIYMIIGFNALAVVLLLFFDLESHKSRMASLQSA